MSRRESDGRSMAQLTLKETVPSPLVLRDMLEEMAVKELQGPAQGDEEEVSERIRDRNLVGILAPRQRAEDMPLSLFEKPASPPVEDDDNLEGDFPPGEELGIEGVGRGNLSGDDGPTELSAPMSKAVCPSSLGLSFCVPLETTSLKVTTHWGHYDKAPSEFLVNPKTQTPKRVWKRRPCGGIPHEILLQAGAVGPIIADESFPDAKVKGLIRRRPDHWSVTLFLVNDGMDKAVAAAYGWSDLDLGHGFHEAKQGPRFTLSESARREVLARLLKLNHERYAEEVAQGLHDKAKGKPKVTGRKGKRTPSDEESLLF